MGDKERALEIIKTVEEILGTPSPFRDAMFSLLDYSKGLGVVNDRRNNVIVKAELRDGRLYYGRIIAETSIVGLTVYENPLSGEVKYDVKYIGVTGANKNTGPASIDVIVSILRGEALVKSRRVEESKEGKRKGLKGNKRKGKRKKEGEGRGLHGYEVD